jgi:tungstate transport system substrate-binding protein
MQASVAATGRRVVAGGLALVAGLLALAGVVWPAATVVVLATSTTTQDSGLLDVLVPMFERRTSYTVKRVAVGTGRALTMAANGEADVVLVHAPALERTYLVDGAMTNRRLVMHNDFVLVGPPQDPAGVRQATTAANAFARIAGREAPFVSRGDLSGTHQKEKELWRVAGLIPGGNWYVESGQGMGATLTTASQKRAYTLADRATYLAFRTRLDLAILLEHDSLLLNVYHVMETNPAHYPAVNAAGARAFADFLVSREAQAAIATFGVQSYGQPLFFADGGKPEPDAKR